MCCGIPTATILLKNLARLFILAIRLWSSGEWQGSSNLTGWSWVVSTFQKTGHPFRVYWGSLAKPSGLDGVFFMIGLSVFTDWRVSVNTVQASRIYQLRSHAIRGHGIVDGIRSFLISVAFMSDWHKQRRTGFIWFTVSELLVCGPSLPWPSSVVKGHTWQWSVWEDHSPHGPRKQRERTYVHVLQSIHALS